MDGKGSEQKVFKRMECFHESIWNALGEKCGLIKNSLWITRVTGGKVNGNTGRGERPRTLFMKQMNTGIKSYKRLVWFFSSILGPKFVRGQRTAAQYRTTAVRYISRKRVSGLHEKRSKEKKTLAVVLP